MTTNLTASCSIGHLTSFSKALWFLQNKQASVCFSENFTVIGFHVLYVVLTQQKRDYLVTWMRAMYLSFPRKTQENLVRSQKKKQVS